MFAMLLAATLAAGPEVTIQPDGDSLLARYELTESVTTFEFAPYDTPQRTDAWSPLDDGWRFDGATMSRTDGAEFSQFTLRMAPDPRHHDRRNIVVSRIGEGWALFLAALGGMGEPATVRFNGFTPDSRLSLAGHDGGISKSIRTDGNDRRAVYIGPMADGNQRTDDVPIVFIASPALPGWAKVALYENAVAIAQLLEKRLGTPTATRPLVLVVYDPSLTTNSTKGSALAGATIQLNLSALPADASDDAVGRLGGLIAHEMVHLWLNEVWDTAENAAQPWLHEGAAEYLADRWLRSDQAFKREAENHLANCLSSLGSRPLDGSEGPLYGQIPYNCGFSLHLAAELAGLSNNHGDVLDLWRTILDRSVERRYDSKLFLAVAAERGGSAFTDFATPLLRVQGGLKPLMLGKALHGLGLEVVSRAPNRDQGFALMQSALRAIGRHYCRGAHGWWTQSDHLRMDTGDRCGPFLPGDPLVSTVNGIGLTSQPFDAYLELRKTCDAGAPLTFATTDGEKLPSFDCEATISEPVPFARLNAMENLTELR